MRAAALLIILALGGCGMQPLYAGGTQGQAATALAGVAVSPIPERVGQLVRDDLLRRMNLGAPVTHRLDVTLTDSTEGFGIRGDESVARERVSLVADYLLIDVRTNAVAASGRVRSDSAVDVVRSDYATVAAERAAAERNARLVAEQLAGRVVQALRAPPPKPAP